MVRMRPLVLEGRVVLSGELIWRKGCGRLRLRMTFVGSLPAAAVELMVVRRIGCTFEMLRGSRSGANASPRSGQLRRSGHRNHAPLKWTVSLSSGGRRHGRHSHGRAEEIKLGQLRLR